MKKYWREITIGILTVLLVCTHTCSPEEKTETAIKDVKRKIPESTGVFSKPDKQTELPSQGKDSVLIKNHFVYSTNPINKDIARQLEKAKDSLEIIKILMRGAQERENITDFSNEKLELKIYTRTTGTLDSISAKYKIKEQEVTVQEKTITKTIIKNKTFGVLLGGGIDKDINGTKLNYGIDAGIRLRSLNIIGGINTNKNVNIKLLIEIK